MIHTLGYLLLFLAAFIAAANFYFSFVRAPIYWCLGRESRNVSGIPLVGTVFLIGALALLERSSLVWIGAIALCVIDTGGLVWFCMIMFWRTMRGHRSES